MKYIRRTSTRHPSSETLVSGPRHLSPPAGQGTFFFNFYVRARARRVFLGCLILKLLIDSSFGPFRPCWEQRLRHVSSSNWLEEIIIIIIWHGEDWSRWRLFSFFPNSCSRSIIFIKTSRGTAAYASRQHSLFPKSFPSPTRYFSWASSAVARDGRMRETRE